MTSIADTERAALCDLLASWARTRRRCARAGTTRDLATHLFVRDREPRRGPGSSSSRAVADWPERAMADQAGRPYDEIVAAVRTGRAGGRRSGCPGPRTW